MTMPTDRHILHVRFPAGVAAGTYPLLLELLTGVTPLVQALPPDTADLDVSGALAYFGRTPYELAQLVRLRALALYGTHTTVGLAHNRMLATLAARDAPPGSITPVASDPYAVASFLRPRPIDVLPGVGPTTAATLRRHGLRTVGCLADVALPTLQRLLGAAPGRRIRQHALGEDLRPVQPHALRQSHAAEHRFAQDALDAAQHRRALVLLTEELGVRLRTEEQAARALTLTVRYADRSTTTRSRTLPAPTGHTPALAAVAYGLYERLNLQRARVRTLSLRADDLTPASNAPVQISLDGRAERARKLEQATDRAIARFGRVGAVRPAVLVA